MVDFKIMMVVTCLALVQASGAEDTEQKKRGATKTTTLNAIPTGSQKQDYTYSIYNQNQNTPAQPYNNQVHSSFYPTQPGNQYYQTPESNYYSSQPPINLVPPPNSSPFVPLNFIPNPGYQGKYQVIPSKSPNGNIQLAIIQPSALPASVFPYQQGFFSPHTQNAIATQQNPVSYSPQGQYSQNYQTQPFSQSYLGQPSAMILLAQPNSPIYNSLLYSNPLSNLYNYYPSNQPKYNLYYGSQNPISQSTDYDKLQSTITQTVTKDNNDIHSADYASSADSSSNYKNVYVNNPNSYKN